MAKCESIEIRKELTDEWKKRGLKEGAQFATLTDIITKAWSDREELADNKMSRVKFELQDVNLFNYNDWDIMNEFFVIYLPKLEKAFQPFIKNLK